MYNQLCRRKVGRILVPLVFAFSFCILVNSVLIRTMGSYTKNLLNEIDIDCNGLRNGNERTIERLKLWNYAYENVESDIMNAENKCVAIKKMFTFPSQPYSKEEANFPLAYGILVYQEISQVWTVFCHEQTVAMVLFMLSAFYHPQNEYCIAVSGSADPEFKNVLRIVENCFPNIMVLDRPEILYGGFEIINSTYACMETLSKKKTDWKYFQYLSGVDVPLRTNLEMVKVMKAFNNTVNAEITTYQEERAKNKNLSTSPLPLYKSSLSATMPRTAVNFLVESKLSTDLLEWLQNTTIPDESFWGTVAGSPDVFPLPGGFNATAWLSFQTEISTKHKKELDELKHKKVKMSYYLSRYQVWGNTCAGKMKDASCVFGVGDYPTLWQQPHLVAHKLYIDFEPATFFCMLKEIRDRTLNPVFFNTSLYHQLPQVELRRGVPWENLTHPTWMYL